MGLVEQVLQLSGQLLHPDIADSLDVRRVLAEKYEIRQRFIHRAKDGEHVSLATGP